jgi:hypothetical protein
MRSVTALFVGVVACGVLAGCGGVGPAGGGSPVALPLAPSAQRLAGVCPDPVVVQQNWEPEAEYAGLYQLIGPGYTVDADRKRVIGPLTVQGRDTGVRLEIRAGGAAIGFTTISAQMYLDRSIMLGQIGTDSAIKTSAGQPVTAVVSPMTKSPEMIMWDPASHPGWRGIVDIGASNAPVLVTKDAAYAQLLVERGLLKASQIDQGHTGSPVRFVTNPRIAEQGYATAEPYLYQHEVSSWGKPVRYQLLSDVGFSVYPDALSVRTSDLPALAGCLSRLVPMLQRAQVDYLADPGPANRLIVDAVARYNDGWAYSTGVADYAAKTLRDLGIVANDSSGPVGGLDLARVQATINTFGPILARAGAPVRPGLTAQDIATDRFLDPSIRLH